MIIKNLESVMLKTIFLGKITKKTIFSGKGLQALSCVPFQIFF
jgi:hypothetical protein